MQISLSSQRTLSHSKEVLAHGSTPIERTRVLVDENVSIKKLHRNNALTGFTLIELLISAAIITTITSIVLVRFNAFDGTTLIKNLAYDVGTSIREAQIYSVSVVNVVGGTTPTFRYPYGIHFVPGGTSYTFFRYNDIGVLGEMPQYNPTGPDTITNLNVLDLGGSMEVIDICAVNAGPDDCSVTSFDVSFRRPEFSALFNAPPLSSSAISAAKIYLHSTRSPSNVWIVEVKLLGQISVYRCIAGTTIGGVTCS